MITSLMAMPKRRGRRRRRRGHTGENLWEGEAREVFVDKLDEWDRSAQDLQAAQKWLHECATNSHVNYTAVHQAVLRGWGAR
ncbi:hypothetical protein GCM10009601_53850 [Streptomyces thermospinosisporus]|uniref:Uncharacterized protein n=1 Tax=Streptomyces thermospinosisporus TaxID=161482 RepID=A0ABP4JW24_9ACTN